MILLQDMMIVTMMTLSMISIIITIRIIMIIIMIAMNMMIIMIAMIIMSRCWICDFGEFRGQVRGGEGLSWGQLGGNFTCFFWPPGVILWHVLFCMCSNCGMFFCPWSLCEEIYIRNKTESDIYGGQMAHSWEPYWSVLIETKNGMARRSSDT